MWGSKRTDRAPFDDLLDDRDRQAPTVEAPVTPPAPTRAESPPIAPPQPRIPEVVAPTVSILGRTLHFHGDLEADEDLVLQGRVEGSITHTGSLTIGTDGSTIGNIAARQIIVEGSVEGDVTATGSVSVRASGTVQGSIVAPRVALADGARFNGSIDMDSAQAAERSTPVTGTRSTDGRATRKQASGTAG